MSASQRGIARSAKSPVTTASFGNTKLKRVELVLKTMIKLKLIKKNYLTTFPREGAKKGAGRTADRCAATRRSFPSTS